MNQPPNLTPTPWDKECFSIDTYEIFTLSRESLEMAKRVPGHYTLRVNPLASKELLHEFGFYYCDTLIEPYCSMDMFVPFESSDAAVAQGVSLELLLKICDGAFTHGRFHRDLNIRKAQADLRYNRWLSQLYGAGKVRDLIYQDVLAGFIAISENNLVLHALASDWRGKGLAKYLWTPVCLGLFSAGFNEIKSSVSVSNIAVMNLYSRLGFRFRNPVDVYHLLTV